MSLRRPLLRLLAFAACCLSCAENAPVVRGDDPTAGPSASASPQLSEEELADLALFVEALREVESKFVEKVDRRALVEAAIEGMLAKFDPYADFLPPDRYARLKNDLDQEFGGVGLHLALEGSDILVVSSVAGSPADEAGVQPGDRLLSVDGVSIEGMTLEDVAERLRGAPGTAVTLKALSAAEKAERELTIERRTIAAPTVWTDAGDDQLFLARSGASLEDRIGYLHVSAFNRRTADELRLALAALTTQQARGVILDLRFNPGGLLNSGVDAADLFLSKGVIASIRGRGVEERTWEATESPQDVAFPVVVLVNGATASAAEILAAALQDHDRATVVGERTFGKGSVQRIVSLEGDASGVKLTSGRYYRPSGAAIDRGAADTEGQNGEAPSDWGVRPSEGGEVAVSQAERLQLAVTFRERALRGTNPPRSENAPDRQLEAACRILKERLAVIPQTPSSAPSSEGTQAP